jgi:heptosyltransferase-2
MSPRKILVTAPSWIGDMVMAQALFMLLRRQDSDVMIDVLVPSWVSGVVARMPEVRQMIPFASRHGKLDLLMRIRTGLRLRKQAYDEAIIMPRSMKSVLPSWFAGIPRRIGLAANLGLVNDVRRFSRSRQELFVRRYLMLGDSQANDMDWNDIPRPALTIDEDNRQALLKEYRLEAGRFVAFAPGAEFGPAKQWPLSYFSELVGLINQNGMKVVVFGSPKEKALGDKILVDQQQGGNLNLCGLTSLPDVIDLSSAARAVVANDSGLMHLAYAAGATTIAIYGSSSSAYTPPLSDSAVILESEMSCRPCFGRTCQYGHYNCLRAVSAADVYREIYGSAA